MTAHPNFVPPPTQIGQHRRRKRRIVIAVVVALALAVGGWAGISYLDRQEADNKKIAEERAKHCSGLDGTFGEGFALSKRALSKRALSKRALSKRALSKRALSKRIDKTGDKTGEQCVGWVVERDYPFGSKDRNVTSVISKITAENWRVRDQAGKANGKPYARVGVLMPMTSAPGMRWARTRSCTRCRAPTPSRSTPTTNGPRPNSGTPHRSSSSYWQMKVWIRARGPKSLTSSAASGAATTRWSP